MGATSGSSSSKPSSYENSNYPNLRRALRSSLSRRSSRRSRQGRGRFLQHGRPLHRSGICHVPHQYQWRRPAGYTVKVMIPITKGLDYVILIGRDEFARDIDLYVYDEDGPLILDDRRPIACRGKIPFELHRDRSSVRARCARPGARCLRSARRETRHRKRRSGTTHVRLGSRLSKWEKARRPPRRHRPHLLLPIRHPNTRRLPTQPYEKIDPHPAPDRVLSSRMC